MELFLIDAIGPFFRNHDKKRVNWSKIPFTHLATASVRDWSIMEDELRRFAREATAAGYNAVTLDDLAHLAHHPLHEPEVSAQIALFREKFRHFFTILRHEFGLKIYLTSDVLPMTPALSDALDDSPAELSAYYQSLVFGVLDDFPDLAGLVLRIGESDGNDVKDLIRTRLHLRSPEETNELLRDLLPGFEQRGRELIFRTWTVGAHRIGDLIWHHDTLERTLHGLDSPSLIVSMKHGESDFFRYLPLNRAFFRVKQRKLLELQARREYEGAGEFPSFIGWDCERFAAELAGVENMAGISVWCQTGGWHRFKRRAFLESADRDIWIRLNTTAAIAVFKHNRTANSAVELVTGPERSAAVIELLEHADTAIRDLFYIREYARQKWFFRRVRVPPLLHVYWDSLFVYHGVRRIMRHFVKHPAETLAAGEAAARLFPRMIDLATSAGLPADDIRHMRDFFHLLLLARSYYFQPYDKELAARIRGAKEAYKQAWPKQNRYRIRISFKPFPLNPRTLSLAANLLLRRKRGYRLMDRLFVLHLIGPVFRTLRRSAPDAVPKILRKSAMGVDVLFK